MVGMNDALEQLRGQQMVIFGMGREGRASAAFIEKALPDAQMMVVDDAATGSQDSHQAMATLATQDKPGILIKSPGIPTEHPLVKWAQQAGWLIHSNTSLFFQLLAQVAPQARIIGITGTKGKSTTTSLIFHLLQTAQIGSVLTGNIGTPPLETLLDLIALSPEEREKMRFVVIELSSHQLRELEQSPEIAVVLQVSPEHLDYYPDFEHYLEAKAAICAYQKPDDIVIYNPDLPAVAKIAARSPGRKLLVSSEPRAGTEYAASRVGDLLYAGTQPIIPVQDLPLLGEHNIHNILPSLAIANELGLEPAIITSAIHSFQPLAHRLNRVREHQGVTYYNDSQATNPEAAIAALRSFPGKTIHLIAGGSDKGLDLSPFAAEIAQSKVKSIALMPPMGEQIRELVEKNQNGENMINMFRCTSMQHAVSMLADAAQPGDVVLLSPACASFGMFKDYQDRGNQFIEAVQALE